MSENKPKRGYFCPRCGNRDLECVDYVPRIVHVESVVGDHVVLDVEEYIDCNRLLKRCLCCTACGKEWRIPKKAEVDYA